MGTQDLMATDLWAPHLAKVSVSEGLTLQQGFGRSTEIRLNRINVVSKLPQVYREVRLYLTPKGIFLYIQD